ncbi:hypothetical protein Tco_1016861, partial [Tanacetum coccineum]
MNYVSQDVYMGLVYSDNDASVWKELESTYDKPIRSALLTRDPLPELNDAYTTVSREESHKGIPKSSSVSKSKLNVTSFVAKSFNNNRRNFNNNRGFTSNNNINRGPNPSLNCKNYGKIGHTIDRCFLIVGFPHGFKRNTNTVKQGFSANTEVKLNDKQYSFSLSSGFTYEQMQKLLSLMNDTSTGSIHANMAGWIINSGANQHLNVSTVGMINVIDITCLNITVAHPNGTLATINHVGNLKLSNNVVLYDVLVVPGYCGTGGESRGLYLFNMNKDCLVSKSNMVMWFNVSKLLWHNRLRHPVDQVSSALHNDLKISKSSSVLVYEFCHRAKQTRDPFPLSSHKSKEL